MQEPLCHDRNYEQVFSSSFAAVDALSAKPLVIGEVASTELGGDKAAWVSDFFARLVAHPEITSFTWFNYDKETDWRVESSSQSLAAFAAGVANQRY